MLGQAKVLVEKMMESEEVNIEEDWKMITMLIGSIDLCELCNASQGDPDVWIQDIMKALDYLHTNSPRTFVNVVQLFNHTAVLDAIFPTGFGICRDKVVCSCFYSNREQFTQFNEQYQEKLEALIASGRYDTTDNFTAVLQPFIQMVDSQFVLSNLAVTCFSLNPPGNRNMALGIWNNLLERVGEKSQVITTPVDKINCPTDTKPYFYTSKNSNRSKLLALCILRARCCVQGNMK